MHDFHLADSIYRAILKEAEIRNLKSISRAVIEIGSIVEHGEEVLPENLDFNIKMLAEKGIASDLELEISRTIGDTWILKEIDGEPA